MKNHNFLHSNFKSIAIPNFIIFTFILTTKLLYSQNLVNTQSFDSIITANTYSIEFDGESITGEGAEWLLDEASKANYFLIGERHGTANIPAISGAMYSKLVTVGYNHAALEIGRYAALETQELLKTGGYKSLKNYLETPTHFQAIAFLDWAEESMLAARIAKESPAKEKAIWGLDQEFLFGFKMYLERLEKLATTNTQKELLLTLKVQLKENRFLMGGNIKAELENLKSLFTDNVSASKLLDAILISNKIYGRFRGELTKIESSTIRENLMKHHLVDLISNYEKYNGTAPKVFFKFGGFHAAPSLGNGKSSLGSFVEEWALSRNETAFNIYLDAVSGHTLVSGQDNEQGSDGTLAVTSFFGSINPNDINSTSKHAFINHLKENNTLFLIDLRPLRKHLDKFSPFLNTKAIKLISGFDAYLAIPNVNPGIPFKQN